MTPYEDLRARLAASPRKWLVTGAAGFIGSHLVETLLGLGQHVVGLDNFSTGSPDNLRAVRDAVGEARAANFRFIEGDIRALSVCHAACRGVEIVLHEAALGSVPRSIENPVETNANNISGFLNMLVAVRDAQVPRFVYAASSSTYGDDPNLPKVESRIGRPLSPYALTKYVNELYADVFARTYGVRSIGLRYFNVFGPRQNPDGAYAAVIPKWIAAMLRGEQVGINGDGETARDFCYVDNAVQANLLAGTVEDPAAVDQVYNVALNMQTSLNELFALLRDQMLAKRPGLAIRMPDYRAFRPGDMRFSRADITRARNLLGFRPAVEVREGLERTIAWHLGRNGGAHRSDCMTSLTARARASELARAVLAKSKAVA